MITRLIVLWKESLLHLTDNVPFQSHILGIKQKVMSKRIRNLLLTLVLLPLITAALGFVVYFHIMLPETDIVLSDPEARVYRLGENRILLEWNNTPFIIYAEAKWVGRPSDYRYGFLGRDFLPHEIPLMLWPRGSYESVPVGDALKGIEGEYFEFNPDGLRIHALFPFDSRIGKRLEINVSGL